MLNSIDRDLYEVIPVGLTRDGVFVLEEDNAERFGLDPENMPQVIDNQRHIIWPQANQNRSISVQEADGTVHKLGEIDVVLPILHGNFGEDGTVQGFFATLGLPYAGGGILDSALCMDKHMVKVVLQAEGIEVAPWITIRASENLDAERIKEKAVAAGLEYPWFVKPARAGSSVGVSKVRNADELAEALEIAFAEDNKILIEQGVSGREIEVGVLQLRNGEVKASLPGEIKFTGRDFYDFEGKYLGGAGVEVVCPAQLSDAETELVQRAAIEAFTGVEGEGLARIDFFLTEQGRPVVNEINTMPGFTQYSMYPKCWVASGLSYRELITELIEAARS